jgi:hypothetical protein
MKTVRMKRWQGACVGLVCMLSACKDKADERLPDLYGARLGMTAGQVRDVFAVKGQWQTVPAEELTWVVDVEPSDAPLVRGTFEFHNGLLVAYSARFRKTDEFARLDWRVTPGAVAHCFDVKAEAALPAQSATRECRVVARDCPAHTQEVKRLLGQAQKP